MQARGLTSVTSLDGVKLEQGCELWGLTSVTSLDGVKLEQGCELWDLTSVKSLDGVKLEQGCKLGACKERPIRSFRIGCEPVVWSSFLPRLRRKEFDHGR